jgi:N-acetylmuramoyl-L-alanine amidase
LFVAPTLGDSTRPSLEAQGVHAVSRFEAAHVLDRVAREQPALLQRLYTSFVLRGTALFAAPVSVQNALARLKAELGAALGGEATQALARLRVLKRKRHALAPPPAPELPRPPLRARQPRAEHYVAVLVKSRSGRPVADVVCELRFADGSSQLVSTDPLGVASARPVPPGSCTIRLVAHDASSWKAASGSQAKLVARGPVRSHVVRHGEHLMRLCLRHGIADWKSAWADAANAALRARRKSPHVLREGDVVVLPGIQIGEVERPVDATHALILDSELEQTLRVRLRDFARAGLDGLEYELSYEHAGRRVQRAGAAATDRDGGLCEQVPMEVESVVLHFKRPRLVLALRLGELDPVQDADAKTPIASGAQARLCGLGYASAAGDVDPSVLARFQAAELGRAQPGGELDAETCAKLEALYGT